VHCLGGGTGVSPVPPGGDARLSTSKLESTAVTIMRSLYQAMAHR
jgi:hypothetical protein